MLTIIHGTDIVNSRKFFLEEKERFNAVLLDGAEVDLTDLYQLSEGGGLFENNKTIFIEQLLTERKKRAERDAIISYLKKRAETDKIFLWEGKELDRTTLSQFKQAAIKLYKLPSSLFAFLDAIKPNNGNALVALFHKSLETSEAEMIFFMLIRQFRILLAFSDYASSGGETISELSRLAPWQKSKFERQARLFEKDLLQQYYLRLFQIELGQKTGSLSSSLTCSLDFFLAEL